MMAGQAVSDGILRVYPEAEVQVRPLADGGEGTVEALVCGMGGKEERITVTGPVGEPVECSYGMIEKNGTAVIEMSGAAGITLVPEKDRNPMYTTTYGVGEVIRDAVQKGCRKFIIGIGGSATNDGGIGMLQALGYGFLDAEGEQVPFGARGLAELERITDTSVLPELSECKFEIACDVTNPLCGDRGCSAVYGPQKGADPLMIKDMDRWLEGYAELAGEKFCGADQPVLCRNVLCNIFDIIDHPLAGVHFLNFLRKITDLYCFSNFHFSAVRLYDPCNYFKKRGFPAAVGPDNSQPLIFQHNIVKIPDANLISKAFGNMMKLYGLFAHSCLYRVDLHIFIADRRSAVFQRLQTVKPCSLLGGSCTAAPFCPFQLHSENALTFSL